MEVSLDFWRRHRLHVGGGTGCIVEVSLDCWRTLSQHVGGVTGCVLEACRGGIDSVSEEAPRLAMYLPY